MRLELRTEDPDSAATTSGVLMFLCAPSERDKGFHSGDQMLKASDGEFSN